MQQFKRGIDPKEAMGIGEVAITKEIKLFYQLNPDKMREEITTGKMEPWPELVGVPAFVHAILQKIKEGKPEKKLRFYAIKDEDDKMIRLHKYTGHYLKFEGITYRIHESLQKK